MSKTKNRNNQHEHQPADNQQPAETPSQSEGSNSSADLDGLNAAAMAVDAAAHADDMAQTAAGDQGALSAEERASVGVSVEDVLPAAEGIILAARAQVIEQYPSAARVLDAKTCGIGAGRLAPLLLKYNAMPPWLKKLVDQYSAEFMFGMWVAGTAWGVYKAVIEDERAAAQQRANGSEKQPAK